MVSTSSELAQKAERQLCKTEFFKKLPKMAPILTVLLPPLCYNVFTQFSQE